MPILNCPTCGSKLEVAAEDLGHLVQCGSCQQTFTAEDPAKPKSGGGRKPYSFKDAADDEQEKDRRGSRRDRDRDDEDDRPSRRRRQWDTDDETHDPDAGYRPRSRRRRDEDVEEDFERRYHAPQTGMGVASMIMGIVSLVTTPAVVLCCVPVGAVCAVLGVVFGFMSLKTDGRGMGIAGIVTSVLTLLAHLVILVLVIVYAAAGAAGPGGFGGGGGAGGGGNGRF